MTWVKICGITNLEDALVAVEAGADAVGFVFYEKSPRHMKPETVREIVQALPENIEKTGVFFGTPSEDIDRIVRTTGLTAAQIYNGDSPPQGEFQGPALEYKVVLAIPAAQLKEGMMFKGPLPGTMIYALLIDSGSREQPGGTGQSFAWREKKPLLDFLTTYSKVIVAGGLRPENVGEAMSTLKPWGVDVSSGVEARPGKKDPEKVRAFVNAVREHDRKVG